MEIIDYTYRKPKYLDTLDPSDVDTAVVHHTGNNNTIKINTDYHMDSNAWAWLGYGYYITDGVIYRVRGINHKNAATRSHNHHTVNIAVEGNFDIDKLSEIDRKALEWLIETLQANHPSIVNIKGHNEYANKSCPGKNINVKEIEQSIKKKEINVEALKLKQELINETIRNDSLDNNIKELKKELEISKANNILLDVENKKLHRILRKSREYSMQVYKMYRENLREQRK